MIEFEIRKVKPEDQENHLKRLLLYLELAISEDLKHKSEAGTTRSERGYQMIAANTCASIARAIGCNETKAKVLSMAVGLYFPKHGHEGLKVVKHYITYHNIDLDINSLGLTTICYYLSKQHYYHPQKVITFDIFYDLLHDYFSDTNYYQESKIVRLVQDAIMDIKKIEHFYQGNPGNLLFEITEEMIELAKQHKTLQKSSILEKYQDKIENYHSPSLTKEEHLCIYKTLDQYIKELTHHSKELSQFDISKEEAVLTYMYLEK